jgi:hypothetical protein
VSISHGVVLSIAYQQLNLSEPFRLVQWCPLYYAPIIADHDAVNAMEDGGPASVCASECILAAVIVVIKPGRRLRADFWNSSPVRFAEPCLASQCCRSWRHPEGDRSQVHFAPASQPASETTPNPSVTIRLSFLPLTDLRDVLISSESRFLPKTVASSPSTTRVSLEDGGI